MGEQVIGRSMRGSKWWRMEEISEKRVELTTNRGEWRKGETNKTPREDKIHIHTHQTTWKQRKRSNCETPCLTLSRADGSAPLSSSRPTTSGLFFCAATWRAVCPSCTWAKKGGEKMVKGGEINRKKINTRKGEVNNKAWKVLRKKDDENQTHVRRLEITNRKRKRFNKGRKERQKRQQRSRGEEWQAEESRRRKGSNRE